MQVREMIARHPNVHGQSADAPLRCIEDCYACAQACTSCADACLAEPGVSDLVQCIRLNLDCSDVCTATGAVASRMTGTNMAMLHQLITTCAEACRMCGTECRKHADMHEHCRVCAEACQACETSCIATLPLIH